MPKITNISESTTGIQVVVESMCFHDRVDFPTIVEPGHKDWPRLAACGKQLKQDVEKLTNKHNLVRVDQKLSPGGLFLEQ